MSIKEKFSKLFKQKTKTIKCKLTGEFFELSKKELDFYKKFSLPLPDTSLEERTRRKLAFVSSGKFFDIKCDKTSEKIRSVYQSNSQFPIYKLEEWLDKDFDVSQYSRSFNLERSFNEQVMDLWRVVPRPNFIARNFENSIDIHYASDLNSCANINIGKELSNCYNSYFIVNSRNCIDNLNLINSENCYECISSFECRGLFFSNFCNNCENSYFLKNCSNCKNCIFCHDLNDKQYHIFNKEVTKAEFDSFLLKLELNKRSQLELAKLKFNQLPSNYSNFLFNCKNNFNSENCYNTDTIINSKFIFDAKNCFEGIGFGGESKNLAQFAMVGDHAKNVFNSIDCWSNVSNLEYCSHCYDSHNLVACVGLSNKSYCILNKQYSESEYKSLRAKIIENLKRKKSWGEFLTPGFCGLPYNLSSAQVFMPLSRAPAKLMGFRWDDSAENIGALSMLSDGIEASQVPQTLAELLSAEKFYICELSAAEVNFTEFELAFLEENKIAPPARSVFQRHLDRVANASKTS